MCGCAAVLLGILAMPPTNSQVRDTLPGFWRRSALTGSWNGARPLMSERGVDLSAVYRSDDLLNAAGGVQRDGAYIHNIDVTLTLAAGKLLGWESSTLFFHLMNNNGARIHPSVGDAQGISNLEAVRTTKLYQLCFQKVLWEGRVQLLVGLYDLNSKFYVTRTSGLFLNPSHGIGSELAQTGRNGPSIFSNTSLGVRLKYFPGRDFDMQSVILDGTPGEPDDPGGALGQT